ncbi:MAG TPA: HAD-IIB family hydrolase [Gammaproteobacteria bacterium]|nr:HAD-IIB family hydrolase [Gammaproteobacteria bacterium]
MSRLLICTDLDRTLIPNGLLPESAGAMSKFRKLLEHPEVTLVYVTGRHMELVEEAIVQFGLPLPGFVIADVGSSIYEPDDSGWHYLDSWEEKIKPDWGGKTANELLLLTGDIKGLTLQEPAKQGPHKLSFYLDLNVAVEPLLAELSGRYEAQGISSNLVWSIDDDKQKGLLDILPASAGKSQSIEFLMAQLDILPGQVVFAGDSGNDLEVLSSHIPSVLVANASDELREQAREMAKSAGHEDKLYLARGGFHGMNGNYSAGILEGVIHFIPAMDKWIEESNEG